MILNILLIIIGFVLLIKGADFLVEGGSDLAKKLHIPEIIIGLTIVSIGTSMPELFVNITSSLEGSSDIVIGNIIGSNLSNMLLILGISAIVFPIVFERETRLIEIPMCLVITLIFFGICNFNDQISIYEGIILLCIAVLFLLYTVVMAQKGEKFDEEDELNKHKQSKSKNSFFKNIIYLALGIVGLKFGGDFVVDNAKEIAIYFGLSEKIIGLTIIAIGTSLPELVTSVVAAIKKDSDIAVGNIIGSNILNIALIIGVSATISPINYNTTYNVQFLFLIVSSCVNESSVDPSSTKIISRFLYPKFKIFSTSCLAKLPVL